MTKLNRERAENDKSFNNGQRGRQRDDLWNDQHTPTLPRRSCRNRRPFVSHFLPSLHSSSPDYFMKTPLEVALEMTSVKVAGPNPKLLSRCLAGMLFSHTQLSILETWEQRGVSEQ